MEFICMDLVGPISPQTSKGNRYMLTVIDMMTGYTIAVAILDKKAETVCKAYRDNVYCTFGESSRILTDNGTEFKSKEMKQICEDLDIKQVFTLVYTPQANRRLEGWHRFLKSCIAKHIRGAEVEWDDLIPSAVSAYKFFHMPILEGVTFCINVWKGSNYTDSKVIGAKIEVLWRKRSVLKNGHLA